VLEVGDAATDAALALVLTGAPILNAAARLEIESLRRLAIRQNLTMELLVAAYAAYEPLSAALALEAPGRTAMVYTPPGRLDGDVGDATRDVLIMLRDRAWLRDLTLLQALIAPEDHDRAVAHRSAGFGFLAELIYMDRAVAVESRNFNSPNRLRIETYREDRRALFLDALELSYVGSQDCPGLAGLRDTEDVLAGHRATGAFDPNDWFVATVDENPVGVLLTAPVGNRSALEIVYMGVSEPWRGKGVANCLMARAIAVARTLRLSTVTLAVDSTNEAARGFYHRWRFKEMTRRRAWIATP
jgi:ribosomal protein S18 acetylase RimI-like enzyme